MLEGAERELKDANEWLARHHASSVDAAAMLNKAENWLAVKIDQAADLEGLQRQDAVHELFTYAVELDDFALAEFKSQMAKIGVKGRAFVDLLKAAHSQKDEKQEESAKTWLS
jgi:hypothetical protein